MIHSLLLSLLGLSVCGGGAKLCTKVGFHHPQALGQVSKRPKAPRDLPSLFGYLLGSITERASEVHVFPKVGFQ